MDDRETKQEIKRRLPLTRLIKPIGKGSGKYPYKARCFAHNDHDPSLSFSDTYCQCWACGFHGDVFNVIAFQNNLDIKNDFNEIVNIAKEMAGMDKSNVKTRVPKKKVRMLTPEESNLLRMGKRISRETKTQTGEKKYVTEYIQPSVWELVAASDKKADLEEDDAIEKIERDKNGEYVGLVYKDYIYSFVQENKDMYYEIVRGKCEENIISLELLKNSIINPSLDGLSEKVYSVLTDQKIGINAMIAVLNKRILAIENLYAIYGGRKTRQEMAATILSWTIEDCMFKLRDVLPSASVNVQQAVS